MNDSQYFPDACSRILNLMRSTFGEAFQYFDGVPNEDLPEAAYPCCIVQKIASTVELGATGQDKMRSQINVHFLTNRADDVNAPGQQDLTLKKLARQIEGRDPATGQWLAGSAMHALRTNITLSGVSIELTTDVQYDVTARPDMPTISEAIVQILTTEIVSVPSRH